MYLKTWWFLTFRVYHIIFPPQKVQLQLKQAFIICLGDLAIEYCLEQKKKKIFITTNRMSFSRCFFTIFSAVIFWTLVPVHCDGDQRRWVLFQPKEIPGHRKVEGLQSQSLWKSYTLWLVLNFLLLAVQSNLWHQDRDLSLRVATIKATYPFFLNIFYERFLSHSSGYLRHQFHM